MFRSDWLHTSTQTQLKLKVHRTLGPLWASSYIFCCQLYYFSERERVPVTKLISLPPLSDKLHKTHYFRYFFLPHWYPLEYANNQGTITFLKYQFHKTGELFSTFNYKEILWIALPPIFDHERRHIKSKVKSQCLLQVVPASHLGSSTWDHRKVLSMPVFCDEGRKCLAWVFLCKKPK